MIKEETFTLELTKPEAAWLMLFAGSTHYRQREMLIKSFSTEETDALCKYTQTKTTIESDSYKKLCTINNQSSRSASHYLLSLAEKAELKEVPLNSDCTAKLTSEGVEVAGQFIPYTAVKALAEACKEKKDA